MDTDWYVGTSDTTVDPGDTRSLTEQSAQAVENVFIFRQHAFSTDIIVGLEQTEKKRVLMHGT